MKKLSDYKGEDAIELWGNILEPAAKIVADKEIQVQFKKKEPRINLVKMILLKHKTEAVEILTAIDPEPITAFNVITRFLALVNEVIANEEFKDFFGFAGLKMDSESSGSATENIVAEEK